MVSRPRWSPRRRIKLFGTRNFGLWLNLSRGKATEPGIAGMIRGFLRNGWSLSLKIGGATFNTRGRYSIDGPGILDYRGKWRETPNEKTNRENSRPSSRGASRQGEQGDSRHPAGRRRRDSYEAGDEY